MSLFKKTCFDCGSKVDDLYDGRCEDCLKQEFPPIKELKQINFKFCNSTKKVCYNNYFYEREKIEEMLPDIVRKNLVLNDHYDLNELFIENFRIEGHKVSFDVGVDASIKD